MIPHERNFKMYSIAIDGPSGSGKSSVAKAVAARLGFLYVDTGAIYRTVGVFAKRNNIDPHDEETLGANLDKVDIKIKWIDGTQHVFLSDEDVSEEIRLPEMSMYASFVSSLPSVRAFLLEMQKSLARENSVVMDGRDIGTVIIPDADLKIFLTASNETRAHRRTLELKAKGIDVKYEDVLADMIERDNNDKNRDVAPAIAAEDAIIFDNSTKSVEDSVCEIVRLLNERK